MNYKRILVPVDFSEQSQRALSTALKLWGQNLENSITLLHVHPILTVTVSDFTYIEPPQTMAKAVETAETDLRTWLKNDGMPKATTAIKVLTGDPISEIIAMSKQMDLVVMGTHGRKGVSRFLLGSVAERVVRGSECSGLVVR